MRGHQGTIKVESALGRGTTFKVFFPCPAQALEAAARVELPEQEEWQGSGLILVVDDEPVVRAVAQAMLTRFGFTVLEARDGAEGVALLRQHAGEINLVLLDMTMPRMNGIEAFQAMKEIKPKLRVILTSGYSEQDVVGQIADRRLTGFVQKPFQLGTLAEKVRELLGREV
jgi:CheY-like chemotaxis protein